MGKCWNKHKPNKSSIKFHQGLHAPLTMVQSPSQELTCANPIVQWPGRAETWPRVWPQGPPLEPSVLPWAAEEDQSLGNTVF